MTDISPVKAYADPQPAPVAFYSAPPPPTFENGSPALDGTVEEDESSTIKCICGYQEDDGSTVFCEKCKTWQHIACYYPEQPVPEVHECTDCLPRSVDAKGAADKQRLRRELQDIGERKAKPKTATKGHKRRVKDPLGAVQPNGWAIHTNNDLQYASERKSGSPRDQPPPSKRPKTSHRTSGSVNMISQAPALVPASRKRASSTLYGAQSPVKSPNVPTLNGFAESDFSPEFMGLYRQPEPPSIDSNIFTDIGVANAMTEWQNDKDALAAATDGLLPHQVFQRIDSIDSLEDVAPVIKKQTEEDTNITAHGVNPQWHYLTVESAVPNGGYIGELKGRIGRKEDYFSDPDNRWELLRHPEPFVFFPPHLPVYIDTRREGTILRYARRSCIPNMRMQILLQSDQGGYHFCFLANEDIHPGDELTINWEIGPDIRQHLLNAVANGDIRKEGFKKIEPWVTCVLANFGGCACDAINKGRDCLLERARRPNYNYADSVQPMKTTKRKSKKTQVSPLSTGHATNSRAGSEAMNHDAPDDEHMDSRSTSGSRGNPGSRDNTPMTHFSADGGDVKMSDRERRKLQQQERLFDKMEEQSKGKRGKRNSAGSTLNTPGLSTSRQLGHSEPSPSARGLREHSNGVARKTSGGSSKANGCKTAKPKPVYVDSSTQTENDKATGAPLAPVMPRKKEMRPPPMSFKRKLLQQAQEERLQRERMRSASVKVEVKSPALEDVTSKKASPAAPSAKLSSAMELSVEAQIEPPVEKPLPATEEDVEMKDADASSEPKPTSPKVEEMPDAPDPEPVPEASQPPIQSSLPPPPSPSIPPVVSTVQLPNAAAPKPTDLHVQMPPVPDMTNPSSSITSVITPGSVSSVLTGSAIAQSPINSAPAPSPFSPSVNNAVNPPPARKKLSLSDYTSRRAKLAQTNSTGVSASPPLAQTQSASSPAMSTASLPEKEKSSPGKDNGTLPPVTEEPKPTPTA